MPVPYKHVLVPTDFSKDGDAAVPLAFRLARDHGAKLLLVHVIEGRESLPNPLYAHYSPNPTPGEVAEMREIALAELRKRGEGAVTQGVSWEARVLEGEPKKAIVEAVRDLPSSVVVIGSHGWGGVKKLLTGSVAKHVLEHAPCPVVLYRQ